MAGLLMKGYTLSDGVLIPIIKFTALLQGQVPFLHMKHQQQKQIL
jgi:hypothetical protein